MKHEELQEILRLHKMWLDAEESGCRANLVEANLGGVNLKEAYLVGANLGGVNLVGANLIETNLIGAYLEDTDIFSFTAGKHFGFYHISPAYETGSYLKIGCHGFSLQYWLENGNELGKKAEYKQAEIDLYMSLIENFIQYIKII